MAEKVGLEELRKEINKINKDILDLLVKRGKIATQIKTVKEQLGLPFHDPKREQEILDELVATNPGPYSAKAIRTIFSQILKESVELMEGRHSDTFLISKTPNRLTKELIVKNFNISKIPFYIAGPCSIESFDQLDTIAKGLKLLGVNMLRGGAFKPRTSPYAFQGLGVAGLKILKEVADKYDLITVTEVMDTRLVETVAEYADILQIGTRNMYNYELLKEIGKIGKPVLLKRAFSATIDEFLHAAEYIALGGNDDIILCERGIRTFETKTRNTLDISAVPLLKSLTRLPVVVDVCHAAGRKDLLIPLSKVSFAAGTNGVMLEVHNNPRVAKSDSEQQLSLDEFAKLISEVNLTIPNSPGLPKSGEIYINEKLFNKQLQHSQTHLV